jgi:ferredoxin-NADP reductase
MSTSPERVFGVVVHARRRAAEAVDLFDLAAADGSPLPEWEPGSHIDLLLPADEERQYSLVAGAPPGLWRIAVLREAAGRGGSIWIHNSLAVGRELTVRGPRNHFHFSTGDAPLVFLAAGIGITPLVAMADAAAAAGVDYVLHYSGRSRETMALVEELADAHQGRVVIHPSDSARLDLTELAATVDPAAEVYCCGPAHYIEAVELAFAGHRLHVERFEAKALTEPVFSGEFEVELALTGVTVTVPPSRSILDVAEEAGAFVLSSCQEGTCGTCETPVLEGEVDHRDSILTPDEQARNDVMYICVSRAACPRLVLEL